MKTLAMIAAPLLLSACMSAGTQVDPNKLAAFKTGETTEPDIVKALGKPTTVSNSSDGHRVLVYYGVHSSPKAATFIPVVGVFAGGANSQQSSAIFTLGANGKLEKMESSQTNMSSSMGASATAAAK